MYICQEVLQLVMCVHMFAGSLTFKGHILFAVIPYRLLLVFFHHNHHFFLLKVLYFTWFGFSSPPPFAIVVLCNMPADEADPNFNQERVGTEAHDTNV